MIFLVRVDIPVTGTMDSINTTDIAVASSPGADVNAVALVYMCHLFGFMKEWLQEGGVSTDSAIVSDSDMIVQRENMFSQADCKSYRVMKRLYIDYYSEYSMCDDNSLLYVTHPERLYRFTECIKFHFMSEMGASDSCSHSSVRSHSDTTVQNTMTLLPKDRHFYTFMGDTLDAGNICQATHDTSAVTFSDDDCYQYRYLKRRGGSKCTYDTPRTDSEQSYEDCLNYRFLKSLGFDDSVCTDWTLVSMCSLFGFVKEWLQEGGVSTDSAIVSDSDMIVQRENMFSQDDCEDYRDMKPLIDNYSKYAMCADNSLLYVTHPERLYWFTRCITSHFMTEMGAEDSCSHGSVRSHIDTTVQNTNTLLSKDRHFHNFLVDTLNAGNVCEAVTDTVTLPTDKCDEYTNMVKDLHYDSRCGHNPQRTDTDSEVPHWRCLWYRLRKSLGADTACQLSLIENCDWYYNLVQSLAPSCICVIGVIGNLLSLCMFGSGAIETPIAYQLLWLAGVDITFILTWWVVEVLSHILHYYSEYYALTTYQTSIVSVLTVCLRPLSYVTRSCTVWLTVLIGLYCYLAVCHPYTLLRSGETIPP